MNFLEWEIFIINTFGSKFKEIVYHLKHMLFIGVELDKTKFIISLILKLKLKAFVLCLLNFIK